MNNNKSNISNYTMNKINTYYDFFKEITLSKRAISKLKFLMILYEYKDADDNFFITTLLRQHHLNVNLTKMMLKFFKDVGLIETTALNRITIIRINKKHPIFKMLSEMIKEC